MISYYYIQLFVIHINMSSSRFDTIFCYEHAPPGSDRILASCCGPCITSRTTSRPSKEGKSAGGGKKSTTGGKTSRKRI